MVLLILIAVILVPYKVGGGESSQFPIRLGDSPIHGRGMFATRDIQKGEIIEEVPVVLFARDDVKQGTIIRDYDIEYTDGVHSAMMLGYGAVYNHSDDNSADWTFRDDKTLIVKANRPIKKGNEIFVSYGAGYWNHRNIKPK